MSKANLQKMGQLEFPKSSLTIFCCFNIHGLISRSKREFRGNSQLVGKTNISFLLCANSKNIVNLWGQKISSECWNKRILLIIKMDILNQNQREGLKSSLTNFYCLPIRVSQKEDFRHNSLRVQSGNQYCVKVKARTQAQDIFSKYSNTRIL